MQLMILRSGALGDVLLLRPALWWLRTHYSDHHLTLIAPGERGRLLADVTDQVVDLDRAQCAWLYGGEGGVPLRLREVLGDVNQACFFLPPSAGLKRAVKALGVGTCHFYPANPVSSVHAAVHLGQGLEPMGVPSDLTLQSFNGLPPLLGAEEDAQQLLDSVGVRRSFAVLHPGSGSARKNAPMETFVTWGNQCRAEGIEDLVITAGEADGRLGLQLAAHLSGSILLPPVTLPVLAGVLALAQRYAGNDSGVSHLASQCGVKTTVFFRSTDSRIWSPVGPSVKVVVLSSP